MTEEIIIDGVNVAGCKDYREVEYKEMPVCMNYYNHLPKPPKETEWQYCAGNKNCRYKQLKRLEQENKDLKQSLEQYKTSKQKSYETLQKRLNDVEWEKRELEQENETINYQWHKQSEIGDEWYKVAEKYKTALEEINTTVKQLLQGVSSNCINNTPYLTALSLIENKINEVLNDSN